MTFQKGRSGNPGGRPRIAGHIRELARRHGEEAFARIVALMGSDNDKVALAAVRHVLDRACGKAPATLAGEGGEGPARLPIVTGIRRDGDDRHEAGAIEHRLSLEIGEGRT
ncbi:MAG: hypothetical protein KDE35_18470 [Geminicoccaceae bacterium]|nr:hypothetical protein [Geminicoccaceae bacterium]